jgi:Family of unknown function (DUF6328)
MMGPEQLTDHDGRHLDHSLSSLPDIILTEAGLADPEHERWNYAKRAETPLQRVDRNYAELLQEVRVAQIGVQVLFAFLLGCAFTQRFDTITVYQRTLFVIALLLTLVTASLLAAPAAYHRVLFSLKVKGHVVEAANRFAIAGLAVLVFSVSSGLLLVLDMVVGHLLAVLLTIAMVAWFTLWWYVVPMSKRIKHQVARPGHEDL